MQHEIEHFETVPDEGLQSLYYSVGPKTRDWSAASIPSIH